MSPALPDCSRIDELLLDYAYGELDDARRREVEAHLPGCPSCRGALAQMQGTRSLMRALPQEPAPQAGLESLLDYAQKAAERRHSPARRWRGLLAALPVGGLLAALLLLVTRQKNLEEVVLPPPQAQVAPSPRPPASPAEEKEMAEQAPQPRAKMLYSFNNNSNAVDDRADRPLPSIASAPPAPAKPSPLAQSAPRPPAESSKSAVAADRLSAVGGARSGGKGSGSSLTGPSQLGLLEGGAADRDGQAALGAAPVSKADRKPMAVAAEPAQPAAPAPARSAAPARRQLAPAAEAAEADEVGSVAPEGAASADKAPVRYQVKAESDFYAEREMAKKKVERFAPAAAEPPPAPAAAPRAEAKAASRPSEGADLFAARLSMAQADARRGEHAAAAAVLAGLVAEQPSHPRAAEALLLLAEEQARAGQSEAAAATCATFLNRHPADPRASRALALRAELLQRLGRSDEAARVRAEQRRLDADSAAPAPTPAAAPPP